LRNLGLETIIALKAPHECVALQYAEGAKLYLPVENIELLSRYGHEEGLLDRLGGGAWQAKKAKLKARIREIADRLMRIAAERALRHAPILEAPHAMWEAFSARFPYTETDDQLTAISDVISDLEKGSPMDRLVVGDVGFGKTEVAMRAAFVAAMAGMQVAVVCPTTLLARQHYRSFVERFRGFPINIKTLSRFVSAKEANATRDGLADGTVDICIGTHALLAKGIRRARSFDYRNAAGGSACNPHLCFRIRYNHHPRGAAARTLPWGAVVLCGAAHIGYSRGREFSAHPCAGGIFRGGPRPACGG